MCTLKAFITRMVSSERSIAHMMIANALSEKNISCFFTKADNNYTSRLVYDLLLLLPLLDEIRLEFARSELLAFAWLSIEVI